MEDLLVFDDLLINGFRSNEPSKTPMSMCVEVSFVTQFSTTMKSPFPNSM